MVFALIFTFFKLLGCHYPHNAAPNNMSYLIYSFALNSSYNGSAKTLASG